jgi:hypothetical protein
MRDRGSVDGQDTHSGEDMGGRRTQSSTELPGSTRLHVIAAMERKTMLKNNK